MSRNVLYVGPDGRLLHRPPSAEPASESRSGGTGRLVERLRHHASPEGVNQRSWDRERRRTREAERDVYEVLRDAELGRLAESRFCPVCRSEAWIDEGADERDAVGCEVCGYRGALSTFNVY